MKTYKVEFRRIVYHRAEIEAENEGAAREDFNNRYALSEVFITGSEYDDELDRLDITEKEQSDE